MQIVKQAFEQELPLRRIDYRGSYQCQADSCAYPGFDRNLENKRRLKWHK